MMKKIRVPALCVLVLALALVAAAGPASAGGPPTAKPLAAVCTAAGGLFFGDFPETRAVCDSNFNAGIVLSEQFIEAARNLCLNAYKADFFVVSGPPGFPTWNCGFF